MPSEPIALAEELAQAIRASNLEARLLGGTAIYLICPSVRSEPLARAYNDLDAAVSRRGAASLQKALEALGWEPDRPFNTVYGHKRLLYHRGSLDLDVFVSQFEQCHTLNIEKDLQRAPVTLTPANLLLTKLQVVQITPKDLTDSLALLLDHPPQPQAEAEGVDLRTIVEATSKDWGWYTTLSDNLGRLADTASHLLPDIGRERVAEGVAAIRKAMEDAPKTLAWKMRDKVGRRVPWYVLPEEK